jgi:hypothetical protein
MAFAQSESLAEEYTMSKRGSTGNSALSTARKALEPLLDFDAWLAALGARDRVNLERHVAALEAEPIHAVLWRRIARSIATLAPHAASTTGQQAVQFFIADGKYRMQVFALEDNRDGKIMIYSVDALDEAFKAELLGKPAKDNPSNLPILSAPGQTLTVETLSAADTPNPSPFYKHMLGWNRKALRVTLPVGSSDAQVAAAESLCSIAAMKWEKKPAATAGDAPKAKVPSSK